MIRLLNVYKLFLRKQLHYMTYGSTTLQNAKIQGQQFPSPEPLPKEQKNIE